jgi:lipopolysaccharide transport system permease protein
VRALAEHVHELRPARGWVPLEAGELWKARELLLFLVWRDVRVRYRQTALGAVWAILQPVLAVTVFTLVFAKLVGGGTDGVPYPVFALAGLIPWQFFAHGVTAGSVSLVHSEQLVRRVYFPRLVVPAGAVLAGGIDAAISLVVLFGLALASGVPPALGWLAVPLLLALTTLPALAAAVILSALNVRYRDVQQIVPFFVQILMFASPIVYPSAVLAEPWRSLYPLNPIVGIIDALRWALFGSDPAPLGALALSLATATVLLVAGVYYFRRTEQTFADVI